MTDEMKLSGTIEMIIEYEDGRTETCVFKNTIVNTGRQAVASCLTNSVGGVFNFFISRMIFGDGGTQGGSPLFVTANRNGLFGITRASKPVIAVTSVNLGVPQAVFTSVLAFSDANGYVLSEMALQLNTGDLYSMATFPDLTKTSQMQITYNWTISLV